MGMASSCTGEGCSYPISKMPLSSSRLRWKSSNSTPFRVVTSLVCTRLSRGGSTRLLFQSDDDDDDDEAADGGEAWEGWDEEGKAEAAVCGDGAGAAVKLWAAACGTVLAG